MRQSTHSHTQAHRHGLHIGVVLALVAGILVAAAAPASGQSGSIIVTSTDDAPDLNLSDTVCEATAGQGDCTLRAAVQNANKAPDADTIVLSADATYPLDEVGSDDNALRGDLDLAHTLTIQGNGAVVSGLGLGDRIVHVKTGAMVTIDRVTIADGNVPSGGGGGIAVNGRLDLTNSTVKNNASLAGSGGGVFYASNSTGGTITQSLIVSNQSSNHGAGLRARVPVTVRWSTITNNDAITAGANGRDLRRGRRRRHAPKHDRRRQRRRPRVQPDGHLRGIQPHQRLDLRTRGPRRPAER